MTDPDDSPLPMLFLGGLKSWEMPEVTALNTVPAHALTIPFPTADTATDAAAPSPWCRSLSGTWDFKLLPRPEAATAAALTGDGWAPITVPGNWTMQGFGTPHYTNIVMPFPRCRRAFPRLIRPACTAAGSACLLPGADGASCCTSPGVKVRATFMSMAGP